MAAHTHDPPAQGDDVNVVRSEVVRLDLRDVPAHLRAAAVKAAHSSALDDPATADTSATGR